ncbi:PucR family transcriptional regulator [Oceanobacillus massiliensis]|uniref:PucR family transcriptional regulator n=1 Tax=Oceanobacillus massiliensis TaxID=1465765 RepID=UPI000288B540|nr:PucR family transcriptional regulator [Oceanobacillus massiliensis]
MRISELLQMPLLEDAKLVTGDVDRTIQNVKMMDAPDISEFLQKNDLLITTAYHFKDDISLLLELIQYMSTIGCAGIGIKSKRFLNEIPDDAIHLAREYNFPLIDLPSEVSLSDVANQTLSIILNIRNNELSHAIQSHQKFTQHIMTGKGMKRLLQEISKMVSYPVILLDPHAKLISASHEAEDIHHKMELLLLNGYHLFLPKSESTYFSIIPKEKHDQYQTLAVFPIYMTEKKRSFLIICGNMLNADTGVALSIKQATNVIAFELIKETALKQQKQRAKNDFFINYLNGNFSSSTEVQSRAKEFGLANEQAYVCVAGRIDNDLKSLSFASHQREMDTIFEFIEGNLLDLPFPSHMLSNDDIVIILLEVSEGTSKIYPAILAALTSMQKKIYTHFQKHISFGVSSAAPHFMDVEHAYTEASDTLQSGIISGKSGFIQTYQTKDVTDLLRIIPVEELKRFYASTLKNLTGPASHNESLLHTLFVYLENHSSISETAKRLYIHRNTVIYRLEKCEKLLEGESLSDPETTFRLRLALRIQHNLQGHI